jgi:hypothetical protein
MRNRLLNTLMLLAFAGVSTGALADDPPAIAGRVALTQGQVSVSIEGAETETAQVNWPVTSGEMITTARGARTELQVGSTFIRLDGDSSLEVLELDEDSLRLRLHYGSASIRITNPDTVAGFELSMPEGRVRMQEPGRLRVDAEHAADTSRISVFEGVAVVQNGGASLTVRAGKSAELLGDDVRTVAAARDAFDDWALSRDRAADAPTASRYVSTDMTGYSDLDRYGNWTTDPEYGALWLPTTVSTGWSPYSDGSWVWVAPWGWTWVDNAPWGYAPFHYGRWVYVKQRWHWAPGHREHHPVWSPALVGWVGGAGWNQGFKFNNRHTPMPARGWYPLSPHERYVPGYHVRDDHLRRLNSDVRPDTHHRGNEHRGLTVVPQDQFGHRGQVVVPRVPHASVPPQVVQHAPAATAPGAPAGVRDRDARREDRRGDQRVGDRSQQEDRRGDRGQVERRGDERGQAGDRRGADRDDHRGDERGGRPGWGGQPGTVLTAPSMPPLQVQQPRPLIPEHRPPPPPVAVQGNQAPLPGQQPPLPVIPEHRPPPQPVSVLSTPPVLTGQQQPQLAPQPQWRQDRRERGEDDRREHRQPMNVPAPAAGALRRKGCNPTPAMSPPSPPRRRGSHFL